MVNGQHISSIMERFSANLLLKQLLFCCLFISLTLSSVSSNPLLFESSNVRVTRFANCAKDQTLSTIKNVIVNGKPGACLLKRGTNVTIEIDFISHEQTKILKAVVHGIIKGIPVPFPIPNSNGCKSCGLTCPIKSGTTYAYKTQIPVSTMYPKIQVEVKWELLDDNSKDLVCVIIPCSIVS